MRKSPFEIYLFTAAVGISLFMILLNFIQQILLKTVFINYYTQVYFFTAGFLVGFAAWIYSYMSQGYRTATTALDYKPLNRAIFVLFAFSSSLIAFLFVAYTVGDIYEIPLVATLLPTYFFEMVINRNELDLKNVSFRRHLIQSGIAVAAFLAFAILDLMGQVRIWEGVLVLAVLSVLLPSLEIKKENEVSSLTFRTLSPLAASFLIYSGNLFYLDTRTSGAVFFYAVTLIAIALMVLIYRKRYKSLQSILISSFLLGLSGFEFYVIFTKFTSPIISSTLLLVFVTWVYGFNYKVLREGSRNVTTAFDLFKKGKFIISFVSFVILVGLVYGNISTISHDLKALFNTSIGAGALSTVTFSTLYLEPAYLALVALAIFFMINIAYRKFNIFLFATVLVMFFAAVTYILSIDVPNVWTPNATEVSSLSIIVTALMFYEPVYRLARSYTSRIPSGLSLARQRGSSRFLHGRYDISMIPSKKNNPDFLGAGGFAYVFKGNDVLKSIPVVIKVPRIFDEESKTDLEKRESIKESIKQLEAESNVLSEINFPGVVSFIEYFREGGQHFLVEEYADGRNLNSYLATKGKEGTRFSEEEIIRISLNLLFSVNFLHLHEIFHRDLNPGNIVITRRIPKIIDFGTSKHLASKSSASFFTHSDRIGVPVYHPPELDSEDKIKASSTYDTYSIGALMCSMITGKFLDNEEMREKYGVEFITRKYLDSEIRPYCNPKIFDIIVKATSLKPAERYKSAFHFIADFLSLTGDFLVTDQGYICQLDHEIKVQVFSHMGVQASIYSDYMIHDSTVTLLERGKEDRSKVGTVEYDNRTGSYVVYPYGKRVIYQKKPGNLSQKVIRSVLNEGDIISTRPDLRDGTFSFYRVVP